MVVRRPYTEGHSEDVMSVRFSRWMMMGALFVGGFSALPFAQAEGSIAGAVSGKPFSVTVAQVTAAKGQPVKAEVVVKPGAGYHINEEFPTKLSLKAPAGVTLAKADLGKADAKMSKDECRFEVTLTGNEAGQKTVPGELKFAVCTDTTCDPQKTAVSIALSVK